MTEDRKISAERRVVLITGAGGGLGSAIASYFHDKGYHVVATDYDASLLSDLEGKEGYSTAKFDVTSTEDAQQVASKIIDELGRLDVIINNAGIDVFCPISEAPPEQTINGFMINTFAALRTTQACLDLLIDSKGVVVNISSESAPLRTPFQFYQSSKVALEAISDVLRRELRLFGVHVAVIRPGAIETPFIAELDNIKNPIENSRYQEFFDRFAVGVAQAAPDKRSSPAEVAALVYHAATDPKRKTMYGINHNLLLKIISKLPAKLIDTLVHKKIAG
jgi:NAD(P)-dependent dehydrogenase (short-subunit alcohol dehydrogenase family)